jgi:hypothetical protein
MATKRSEAVQRRKTPNGDALQRPADGPRQHAREWRSLAVGWLLRLPPRRYRERGQLPRPSRGAVIRWTNEMLKMREQEGSRDAGVAHEAEPH